jgi:dipeptidyl aminopeptidase/acylaminoacyl peptidase
MTMFDLFKFLVNKGFIIASMNFSGSIGLGEDLLNSSSGNILDLHFSEVEDWLEGLISKMGLSSKENIWLFGRSAGAFFPGG